MKKTVPIIRQHYGLHEIVNVSLLIMNTTWDNKCKTLPSKEPRNTPMNIWNSRIKTKLRRWVSGKC